MIVQGFSLDPDLVRPGMTMTEASAASLVQLRRDHKRALGNMRRVTRAPPADKPQGMPTLWRKRWFIAWLILFYPLLAIFLWWALGDEIAKLLHRIAALIA